MWTDEYEDAIHIVLQSLNEGFVVALCFFPINTPEGIGTALKVTNHARILARIIGIGATVTLARVVKRQPLSLRRPSYLDYGPSHVVREFPRQIEPRCALLVSVFVRQCRQIRALHLLRLAHLQLVSQPLFRESLALRIVASKIKGRTMRQQDDWLSLDVNITTRRW